MIAVSSSLLKRAELLSIIIMASLIGPVRLKESQDHRQQQENNASMIITSQSIEFAELIGGENLLDLADSLVVWENVDKSREHLSQNFEGISTIMNSTSSLINSSASREELYLNNRTSIRHHIGPTSLRLNYSRNLRLNESELRKKIIITPEKEEIQLVEIASNCKSTIFDSLKEHMPAVSVSSAPSAKLEKELTAAASSREPAKMMEPPTMVDELKHWTDGEHHKHQKRPRLPEEASTPTASPGEEPPDNTMATTDMSNNSSPLPMKAHASNGGGRSESNDINLRHSRSAPEDQQPSGEEAGGVMMTSSIQSVVGQPLTIPCTNQTSDMGQALFGSSGSVSGPQQQHQRNARGHRLQKIGSRGGGGKPVANGQGISLIVWHKDGQLESPIFTVDARGASSLREAKQQTGLESLKGRAHLEESTRVDSRGLGSVPALVIDEANGQDGGVYTCTVEFYEAPTQTHQMRVLLINPPRNMLIQDHLSNRKTHTQQQSWFGPYDEESHLALVCEAEPGEPVAQVSWWQLTSVSSLPSAQTRASSSSRRPFESAIVNASGGGGSSSPELILTTITLERDNHGSLEDTRLLKRDYFVALHSTTAISVRELPFTNGHQLRHWTRVKDQINSNDSVTGRIKSIMEISSLSRSHFNNGFLCIAHNNDFLAPLNASIKLDLNLKPTEVKIMNKANYVFNLGQKITIECQVYGSRPAAKVRWFKGSVELETTTSLSKRQNDDDGLQLNYVSELNRDINNNLTKISYLTLVPQLSDNQQSLSCSASNPKMPHVPSLSDSITMNVIFPAQMSLQFGSSIKQEQIRLGSDVFMDCVIQSNPPINELTWLFNNQPLSQNASAGIIMSQFSLVIQGIRIEHCGKYQCVAQNSLGKFHSNKLELKPKFKPVCDYSLTKTKYKVALNQPVKIECNVLAEPGDDIHFVWQFNQTLGDLQNGDSIVVQPLEELKQYETNFTKSYVTFTPRRNYGQLLCSASNPMGRQEKPCVIQVVASELPEPVFSCLSDNVTDSSFNVLCQSPSQSSSSSRSTYLLELYTNESHSRESIYQPNYMNTGPINHLKQRQEIQEDTLDDERASPDNDDQQQQQPQQLVKRISSEGPSFQVTDLKPDTSYSVMIYVQNSKGRSKPVFHPASTLPADSSPGGPLASISGGGGGGPIQFNNNSSKRQPNDKSGGGLSDRLISYLKVGNYLNGDSSKPLLGIALIVLLCTITIATVTFFVIRVCSSVPPGHLDNRDCSTHRKRGQLRSGRGSRGGSGYAANGGLDKETEKLRTYNGKEPQIDTSVQLNLATPSRLKALAGSGSDTSRETNTDSTLISLFRTGHHEVSVDKQQQQLQLEGANRRPSYGSTHDSIQGLQCETNLNCRATNFCSSPPMVNMSTGQFNEHHKLNSVYSTTEQRSILNSPQDLGHISTTPQISLQSGSDCTSNNELQGDASEFHDKLLIKCRDNLSEPVYVIGRDGQLTGPGQCVGSKRQQVRILNHSVAGFWPTYSEHQQQISSRADNKQSGSVSGAIQVSTSTTADSFVQRTPTTATNLGGILDSASGCQPLGEEPSGLPIPISFLPSSVSIPVSLAAEQECPHLAAGNYHHRRLSHEFLGHDLCLASPPLGPYLTLAPATDQSLRYQRSYGYVQGQQQQNQQQQQLTRMFPYSDGYGQERQEQLVATLTNFAPGSHYHCENQPFALDVVPDNLSRYQTLDDTYRRSKASPAESGIETKRAIGCHKPQRICIEDDGPDMRSDITQTNG